MGKRGEGSIKIFHQIFLSHSAEDLRRESFSVALIWGTEKIWIRGGVSRSYIEIFLSHGPENDRR